MLQLVSFALVYAATLGCASRVTPNKAAPNTPNKTLTSSSSSNKTAAPPNQTKVVSNKDSNMAMIHTPHADDAHHSASTPSAEPRVRRFHRTAQEELLDSQMQRTLQDSSHLQSDLQRLSSIEKIVLHQADAGRLENQHLEEQLSESDKKLKTEARFQAEKAALAAEVSNLGMKLEMQRQQTARQQSISLAVSRKVMLLENDLRVMSKAWKTAVEHQASMVKSLRAQVVDAQLAASAGAAKTTKAVNKAAKASKSAKVAKAAKMAANKPHAMHAVKVEAAAKDEEEDADAQDEQGADIDEDGSDNDIDAADDDDTI